VTYTVKRSFDLVELGEENGGKGRGRGKKRKRGRRGFELEKKVGGQICDLVDDLLKTLLCSEISCNVK